MPRLFVAIWPPPDVVEALRRLERPALRGVRWTTPAQWHVTLRFLGEADPSVAGAALRRLRHPPVRATFSQQAEQFDGGAVVVDVVGLDELASAVASTTADIGRPAGRRPFRGHLTLARTKRCPVEVDVSSLAGPWPVTAVTVVRSELHPDGARYTVIEEVDLA